VVLAFTGYANASFSSLDVWRKPLTQTEVASLYRFYQSIVGANNASPVINVRQLRHFSPTVLHKCFKSPSTLAEIYQQLRPSSRMICWRTVAFRNNSFAVLLRFAVVTALTSWLSVNCVFYTPPIV